MGSMINAFGVHNYFGGFPIGVRKSGKVRVAGSLETWEPAKRWAPRMGIRVWEKSAPFRADMVFGNPPCSRFSSMSYSKFSDEQREDLHAFTDLVDVLNVSREVGAELVWIENGPLMFSRGENLLFQFEEVLGWKPYIMMVKINTRQCGLPQDRPRTHVFVGRRPFANFDARPIVYPGTVWDFMQTWNSLYQFEPVPSLNVEEPVLFAAKQNDSAVFLSVRPKIISEDDDYTFSMVSSRHFVWLKQNRWWSVDEYAAIMGYPADVDFDYAEPGIPLGMALLSKSVSPSVSEYLTERVVVPYFDTGPRGGHGRVIKYDLTTLI